MIFLTRNTILTAFLLISTAVETKAEACSETSVDCAGEGTKCTYNESCLAGDCQYVCPAPTDGIAGGQAGFDAQQQNQGTYLAGRVVDLSIEGSEVSNIADVNADAGNATTAAPDVSKQQTNTDNIDVGATGALSTSGSSSATKVASYLLLAVVGVAATIAGL